MHNPDLGLLFIRLAVGAIFFVHGWMKFSNLDGTISFFATLGLGALFAYLVAAVEFLGGLAMILGLSTRVAGILLAIVMVFAIVLVKGKMGFAGGYELDLLLLASALGVALIGPGKIVIGKKR